MTDINAAATVWWDMDRCPVPEDYDICQVGPCIKFALEKLGCDGPITINAMGDLKGITAQVLQSLTSSGVFVQYLPFDKVLYTIEIKFSVHDKSVPRGNTKVFIMDTSRLEKISWIMLDFKKRGFKIVVVYPEEKCPEVSLDLVALPWRSVLKYAKKSETQRLGCPICFRSFSILEEFTDHLNSDKHAYRVAWKPPKIEETSEVDVDLYEQDDVDLDEQDDPELKKQKT